MLDATVQINYVGGKSQKWLVVKPDWRPEDLGMAQAQLQQVLELIAAVGTSGRFLLQVFDSTWNPAWGYVTINLSEVQSIVFHGRFAAGVAGDQLQALFDVVMHQMKGT